MIKYLALHFIIFFSTLVAYAQIFQMTNCKYEAVSGHVQNRIIKKEIVADKLHLKLGLVANCEVDSTYSLKAIQKGEKVNFEVEFRNELSACNCYFEIDVQLTYKESLEFFYSDDVLLVSAYYYKVVEPKFEIYKGDTINYYDLHGFMQGKHYYFENGIPLEVTYYVKNHPIWSSKLSKKGRLNNIMYFDHENNPRKVSRRKLNLILKKRDSIEK